MSELADARFRRFLALLSMTLAANFGCKRERTESKRETPALPSPTVLPNAPTPTATVPTEPSRVPTATPTIAIPEPQRHCPSDMAIVDNHYCVDRYEIALVDEHSGEAFSPYFPVLSRYDEFLSARARDAESLRRGDAGTGDSVPMPELPSTQASGKMTPMAVSRPNVVPNGHLTLPVAQAACKAAGKRLCRLDEWKRACRGAADQKFPYGSEYRAKQCNVFREDHPGHILYGSFSVGMQDPRMGTVASKSGPLLRKTGETRSCASQWGKDAIYDMVGNLDEWVDDPEGTFVGGFFSRATKEGCDSIVTAHAGNYRDYSIGARCCSDAK